MNTTEPLEVDFFAMAIEAACARLAELTKPTTTNLVTAEQRLADLRYVRSVAMDATTDGGGALYDAADEALWNQVNFILKAAPKTFEECGVQVRLLLDRNQGIDAEGSHETCLRTFLHFVVEAASAESRLKAHDPSVISTLDEMQLMRPVARWAKSTD